MAHFNSTQAHSENIRGSAARTYNLFHLVMHCKMLYEKNLLLLLTYFYILAVCRFKKKNAQVELTTEEKAHKTMSLPKEWITLH